MDQLIDGPPEDQVFKMWAFGWYFISKPWQSHIVCELSGSKSIGTETRLVTTGTGRRGKGGWLLNGCGVSLCSDKSVWELDRSNALKQCLRHKMHCFYGLERVPKGSFVRISAFSVVMWEMEPSIGLVGHWEGINVAVMGLQLVPEGEGCYERMGWSSLPFWLPVSPCDLSLWHTTWCHLSWGFHQGQQELQAK
jgi:hypothetical protein